MKTKTDELMVELLYGIYKHIAWNNNVLAVDTMKKPGSVLESFELDRKNIAEMYREWTKDGQ